MSYVLLLFIFHILKFIYELFWLITMKLCHMIGSVFNAIIQVPKCMGPLQKYGRKRAKFGMISDNFRLWSWISSHIRLWGWCTTVDHTFCQTL